MSFDLTTRYRPNCVMRICLNKAACFTITTSNVIMKAEVQKIIVVMYLCDLLTYFSYKRIVKGNANVKGWRAKAAKYNAIDPSNV